MNTPITNLRKLRLLEVSNDLTQYAYSELSTVNPDKQETYSEDSIQLEQALYNNFQEIYSALDELDADKASNCFDKTVELYATTLADELGINYSTPEFDQLLYSAGEVLADTMTEDLYSNDELTSMIQSSATSMLAPALYQGTKAVANTMHNRKLRKKANKTFQGKYLGKWGKNRAFKKEKRKDRERNWNKPAPGETVAQMISGPGAAIGGAYLANRLSK